MNTLISLLDDAIPLIAVGFVGNTPVNTILEAKTRGLDIAELRIDHYPSSGCVDIISEARKFADIHTIATIRIKNEGGKWDGSEEQRLKLFRDVIPHVDAVDIELHAKEILPSVIQEAHDKKKLALVSYHNFNGTPDIQFLQAIVDDAWSQHADLVKIAVQVGNPEDLQTLAMLTLSNKDKRLVAVAMGSDGLISRVFFPALGSRITFAYIGAPTAPGQLKFVELFQLLREFYPRFNQRKINELKILEAA
jgi:3-dehydroquinate dehydratase-1